VSKSKGTASRPNKETIEKNESAVLREIADRLSAWRESGPGENGNPQDWVKLSPEGREAAVTSLRLLRDNASLLRRCKKTYDCEDKGGECEEALFQLHGILSGMRMNYNPPEHIENYWGWGNALALPGFIEELRRWADELQKPKPKPRPKLGPIPSLIYEKLLTLPEHEAMPLPKITEWLWTEHQHNLSDANVYSHVMKLEPWGLQHDKRIGYSITAEQKSIG
jgi:hypothetical protein